MPRIPINLYRDSRIEARIDALSASGPSVSGGSGDGEGRIQSMLASFRSQSLSSLSKVTLDAAPSLHAIADHIESVANMRLRIVVLRRSPRTREVRAFMAKESKSHELTERRRLCG